MRRCTLQRPSCGCWSALRLASIPLLLKGGLQAFNRSAPHAITRSGSFTRQYRCRLVRRVLRARTLANLQLYGRAPSSVCQARSPLKCVGNKRDCRLVRGALCLSRDLLAARVFPTVARRGFWSPDSKLIAHFSHILALAHGCAAIINHGMSSAGVSCPHPLARGARRRPGNASLPAPPLAVCLGVGRQAPCSFCACVVFVRLTCRVFRRCVICFADHSRDTFARQTCVNPYSVELGVFLLQRGRSFLVFFFSFTLSVFLPKRCLEA